MAIAYLSKAWHDKLATNSTELLVLLALADYADEDGWCYPRVRTLTEKTMLSDRTVRQALRDLRSRGVIQVWDRYVSNTQIGSVYCLVGLGGQENQPPDFAGKTVKRDAEIATPPAPDAGPVSPEPPAKFATPPAPDAGPPAPNAGGMNPSVESVIKDYPPSAESLTGIQKEVAKPPSFSRVQETRVTAEEEATPLKPTPALFVKLAGVYKEYNRSNISKAGAALMKKQAAHYDENPEYAKWMDARIASAERDARANTKRPPKANDLYSLVAGLWWEEWQRVEAASKPPTDIPLAQMPIEALMDIGRYA